MKPHGAKSPISNHKPRITLPRGWVAAALAIAIVAIAMLILLWWLRTRPPKPFSAVMTVAGPGLKIANSVLPDLFGVAIDDDDQIFFSDGTANSIYRINPDGSLKTITSELDMPSAIAFAPDGSLVVANTGAHTIVRVDVETGRESVIAGNSGTSGYADGEGSEARFNAPIGIAVSEDGQVFVADTYNDRIRTIGKDGRVRTIAGGNEPGFRDGMGSEARFDTPCGLAIAPDGSLLVADTANHRIRRVTLDGNVTTIAGTGEETERDGKPLEAAFNQPIAIAVRRDGMVFIAGAYESSVRLLNLSQQQDQGSVTTLAGGFPPGLADGEIAEAKLNRPSALAFASNDALVFTDTGNGLVRAFVPQGKGFGFRSSPEAAILKPADIRGAVPPRWPFDPPQSKRDIAGTFGEVRGEMLPSHDSWFHNGLDIPGAYGETVRAVFTERVTQPLAIESAGGGRERLLLPLISYIHLRIGRYQNDRTLGNFPNGAITFRRDELGQVVGVRVRRGTRIGAGDAIGTLNRLNHVHLIAGPYGSEINALAALQLPGLVDTVAPAIESVMITNDRHNLIFDSAKTSKQSNPTALDGRLRIIVRAYDQVDGNPRYRRLGLYRLGYQLFNADGSPAKGFDQPRYNIIFERLPLDQRAVPVVYAEGSQSGYEGMTIFNYIVTNVVRDGEAREEFLDISQFPPGSYALRVLAEDFFGNQSLRDLPVAVVAK
jgi:sugar lactone lactonase YvrE